MFDISSVERVIRRVLGLKKSTYLQPVFCTEVKPSHWMYKEVGSGVEFKVRVGS